MAYDTQGYYKYQNEIFIIWYRHRVWRTGEWHIHHADIRMRALISDYPFCTWGQGGLIFNTVHGLMGFGDVGMAYTPCACWYQDESSDIRLLLLYMRSRRAREWHIHIFTQWWYQNGSSDTRPSVLYRVSGSGGQWNGIYTMLLSEWELRYYPYFLGG